MKSTYCPSEDDWYRISMLIEMREDGAVVYQSTIDHEFPLLDKDRLHLCIEDSILIYDGVEEIAWNEVAREYANIESAKP